MSDSDDVAQGCMGLLFIGAGVIFGGFLYLLLVASMIKYLVGW
jgi:hypothetical protein